MPRCSAGSLCSLPQDLSPNVVCSVCHEAMHNTCGETKTSEHGVTFVCQACSKPAAAEADTGIVDWDSCLLPHNQYDADRLENPYTGGSGNRTSVYWKLFHVFTKDHPLNMAEEKAGHAACNICGRCVKVNGGSTSALKQHARSNHAHEFQYLMSKKDTYMEKKEPVINPNPDQPHPEVDPARLSSPFGPKSNRSSVFWKFFHVFAKNEINIRDGIASCASCNICGRTVKLGAGSTSPLLTHLQIHHKEEFASLNYKRKTKAPKTESSEPSAIRALKYQKTLKPEKAKHLRDIHRSIAIWCIQSRMPLDIVQDTSFRNILKAVRTSYPLVTENDLVYRSDNNNNNNVQDQVHQLAQGLRQQVQESLADKSFVCSTYHWLARGGMNFAILFANYVENAKVHRVAMHVVPFDTTEDLDSTMSLQRDKHVPYAITDVEKNKNVFGTMLEELNNAVHVPSIGFELTQLTNIAFQSRFFGDDNNQDDSPFLCKARDLASFLCNTPGVEASLRDAQVRSQTADAHEAALPAIEDICLLYLSTYNMAARLLKLRQVIGVLVSSGTIPSSKALTSQEWQTLGDLVTVLKPFSQVVKSLKGAQFVSVSLVPFLLPKLREDIEKTSSAADGLVASRKTVDCTIEMLKAFDRRFGDLSSPSLNQSPGLHKSFYFALLLDPRFKNLNGVSMSNEQKEALWSALEEEMQSNELEFRQDKVESNVQLNQNQSTEEAKGAPSKRQRLNSEDDEDYLLQHFGRMQEEAEKRESLVEEEAKEASQPVESLELNDDVKADCAREIAHYREEKGLKIINRESGEYSDPFGGWWRDHHDACPILWRLAQVYLSIPALTECNALHTSSPYPIPTLLDSTGGKVDPKLVADVVFVRVMSKQMDLDMMKMS